MKLHEIVTLTEMNRRDFLKVAGGAAIGATAATMLPKVRQKNGSKWVNFYIEYLDGVGNKANNYMDVNSINWSSKDEVSCWITTRKDTTNPSDSRNQPDNPGMEPQFVRFNVHNRTFRFGEDEDPVGRPYAPKEQLIRPDTTWAAALDYIKQHSGP